MQSVLSLTKEEGRALVSLMRSRVSPAADVKRARLMIMLDDGLSWKSISNKLSCSPDYINRWRRRVAEDRLGGHGSCLLMLFQLNPSSSMIINRARLTSAAGETRDRVNDTNARRSSLVRLKTDCMLHIVLLKSMLHNTRLAKIVGATPGGRPEPPK